MLVFWSCAQASSCQYRWLVHHKYGGIPMIFSAPARASCLSPFLNSSAVSFVQFNPWPTSGQLMSPTPAVHCFKMRLALGCDQFAAANAGTPKWQQNGVPALRLSHPTRRSDSTNALPWVDDACGLPLNEAVEKGVWNSPCEPPSAD